MKFAHLFLTYTVLSGELIVRQQADTVYIARQSGIITSSPKSPGETVVTGEHLLTLKESHSNYIIVADKSGNIKEITKEGSFITLGETVAVTESNYWLGIFISSNYVVFPKIDTKKLCINDKEFVVDKIKSNYENLYFTIPKGQQTALAYEALSSYINVKGKAEISLDSALCK